MRDSSFTFSERLTREQLLILLASVSNGRCELAIEYLRHVQEMIRLEYIHWDDRGKCAVRIAGRPQCFSATAQGRSWIDTVYRLLGYFDAVTIEALHSHVAKTGEKQ